MSKTSRLRGRSLSVLEDLIEERDKLIEDSKEYNDLTEEIQLIQNDMVTIDIMEDKGETNGIFRQSNRSL